MQPLDLNDAVRPASAGPPAARSRLRARVHGLTPAAVAAGLGLLILVSGWDALRPVTPIEVVPAVFVHAPIEAPALGQGEDGAGRSGRAAQAAGWLEADPFLVACTALADGVVEEMLVLEGQHVGAGDVVARLVSEDARLALARAEADVRIARAQAESAAADLAAAETDWENPVERDRALAVSRAMLAETEAELAQLPALIASETATLERLREEHQRLEEASASGAATAIELVIAAKQAEAQGAAVEVLERRRPMLEAARDRLAAEALAAERNAQLRVSERRALDLARAASARASAELAGAEARLDEARLRLHRMEVRAPISGFVQRRLKAPGDKVMLGMDDPHSSHLLHLYDPERLQVRVDVPLADAGGVVVGQRCEVVVDVLPDRVFAGEVTRITHEADLQKNTLQVKVRVIDPSPLLKPEMLTRVRFLAGEGRGVEPASSAESSHGAQAPTVRVPERAVGEQGGRSIVWVVRERRAGRGTVRPVEVSLGEAEESWRRVRGEIRPGDLLAIDPEGLAAGQRVRVRRAGGGA